jgi:hypothetical protein
MEFTSGQLSLIESCARECAIPLAEGQTTTFSDEMAVYDAIANHTRGFTLEQLAHVRSCAVECDCEHTGAMSVFEAVRKTAVVVECLVDDDVFAFV